MYRYRFHYLKVRFWWPNKRFIFAHIDFKHPVASARPTSRHFTIIKKLEPNKKQLQLRLKMDDINLRIWSKPPEEDCASVDYYLSLPKGLLSLLILLSVYVASWCWRRRLSFDERKPSFEYNISY